MPVFLTENRPKLDLRTDLAERSTVQSSPRELFYHSKALPISLQAIFTPLRAFKVDPLLRDRLLRQKQLYLGFLTSNSR